MDKFISVLKHHIIKAYGICRDIDNVIITRAVCSHLYALQLYNRPDGMQYVRNIKLLQP